MYLSAKEREHLHKIGTPQLGDQPAGTYAKHILSRLLIDLSWNSSRLEGHTYSLLDTKRLIDLGQQAEGKDQLEAQMILNHKDAIEIMVSEADEIGFNRYTIFNLHGMIANNLLPNPDVPGLLRRVSVGMTGSVFHPLEVLQPSRNASIRSSQPPPQSKTRSSRVSLSWCRSLTFKPLTM